MKFAELQNSFYNSQKRKLKSMILFGVPGAGKGTYGSLIQRDWGYTKITPGDSIRRLLTKKGVNEHPKYLYLKNCVEKGLFVDDDIVIDLVTDEMANLNPKGLIFDGIPRNIRQVEMLEHRFDLENSLIVNMELREDILIEKLMGRRVCLSCGKNYNLCTIDKEGYYMKPMLPKKEGSCDNCGGKLVKRADDTELIIKKRIDVYNNETIPVIERLMSKGLDRVDFVPRKGVDDYHILKQDIEKYIQIK